MASYTQCKMERPAAGGGKQLHTAFIPTSFAKIGRHVEILVDSDDGEGTWSKGWVVISRGGTVDHKFIDTSRAAQKDFERKLGR